MGAKQNILVLLTPGFPANEADSCCLPAIQQFVLAVNKGFAGIKIIIIPFQYPFTKEAYEWHGNTIIPLNGRNKGKIARLLTWRKAWKNLHLLQQQYTITGLLSFWYGECALIGKHFSVKYGIQHYCWMRGQDARPGNKYIRITGLGPTMLIALSEALANEMDHNYGILPAHTIFPGVNTDLFDNPLPIKDIDIIGVGSLIPLKQFDVFIRVIEKLAKQQPGIRAVICGTGPERERLEETIRERKLDNNIWMAGERPYAEVLTLMQRSRLLLHPSSYEGFGLVMIEALYAGAQVISFCQPVRDPIQNWHVVATENEMVETSFGALANRNSLPVRVLPFNTIDMAKQVIALFLHKA